MDKINAEIRRHLIAQKLITPDGQLTPEAQDTFVLQALTRWDLALLALYFSRQRVTSAASQPPREPVPVVQHIYDCSGRPCHHCNRDASDDRAQYQLFLCFDRMLARYGTAEAAEADGWVMLRHSTGFGKTHPAMPLDERAALLRRVDGLPPKERKAALAQAMEEWHARARDPQEPL